MLNLKELYPPNWNEIKRRIKRRDGYQCSKCKRKFPPNSTYLKVHHIVPLSKGGSNLDDNLVCLCGKCHTDEHPHLQRFENNKKSSSKKRVSKFGKYKKYKLK